MIRGGRAAGRLLAGALAPVAALGLASQATAAERHAAPGGTGDPAVCTAAEPCDLEQAVEHSSVADGDRVLVHPGVHRVDRVEIDRAITLAGATGGARPTVTGSGSGLIEIRDPGAVVNDLRVDAPLGAALMLRAGEARRVEARSSGGGGEAPACLLLASATIADSICAAESSPGVLAYAFPGGQREVTVRLVNVTMAGPSIALEASADGFYDLRVLVSNSIVSLPGGGGAAGVWAHGSTINDWTPTVAAELDHSSFGFAQTNENGSVTPNDQRGNRGFSSTHLDRTTYRQTSRSPTIDQGAGGAPGLGSRDIDGEPRVQGDGVDIGADETDEIYQPPGSAPFAVEFNKPPPRRVRTKRRKAKVTFRFSAREVGRSSRARGSRSFQCRIDRRRWRACSSPKRTRVRAKRGRGKRHVFRVRAVDSRGAAMSKPLKHRFRAKRKPRRR